MHIRSALVAVAGVLALAGATLAGAAGAAVHLAGFAPPQHPPANLWPQPDYTFPPNNQSYVVGQRLPPCWRWLGTSSVTPQPSAPLCLRDEVAATNRAHRAEGIARIVLPRNFAHLSAPEQLLVLVDVERVSRGEPPVIGVSAVANVYAETAARHNVDPELPPGGGGVAGATGAWGANWAAAISPLDANYSWMYTDGWEGKLTFNFACTAPQGPGCWGHRDNILTNGSRMACYASSCTIVMGAGYVKDGWGHGYGSYTELFVQVARAAPHLYYTWAQAVAEGARA